MNLKNVILTAALTMGASVSAYANQMVKIDGSSTVYPIIEAVAEEFSKAKENKAIRVTAGFSGTGGGFKKLISGEIDICNASRPIKDSEKAELQKKNVKYHEIKVAYDGLSIVVNPANTFVDYLSVEELAKMWAPGSKVKTWADVRSSWPKEPIKLYGPGTDSGTFDFFTEVINKKAQVSRSDYTKSEDDNVLVQGVGGDKNALAYLGHSYVEENKDKLKVIPIGPTKDKAIYPTTENIKSNSYAPLSRPLYIYVADNSLKRKEVKNFVAFMLKNSAKLVAEVGYVPLTEKEYQIESKVLAR